jgi:proteasome lid subunit RPN8/RPN11
MLILSPEHFSVMTSHARGALPNEACGLFAGVIEGDTKTVKAVYCLSNTDKSPEHFSMAPEEQFKIISDIRKTGYTLLGNFHSHPSTPARPSDEDIRLAFDPSLSYIIISLKDAEPILKSFTICNGKVSEEHLKYEANGHAF